MRLQGIPRRLFDLGRNVVDQRVRTRRPRSIKLKGLRNSVEVITDEWGVPHIHAQTSEDLFFAQGFVTARDRLFQLDYSRHAVSGRLCELVGRRPVPWRELTVHLKDCTTFDVDVMLRTFGLQRAALDSMAAHSDEAQGILRAYTAGVNAYIETGARPLEHRLLGVWPTPWQPSDCLLMLKAIGFELNFAWRSVLLGALLQNAGVPEDVAKVLWPHFPAGGETIVHGAEWAKMARELASLREAANQVLGIGNAPGVGSNSYAVAGSHTRSGEALLANDTHLVLTCPVPWHEVRLHGGDLDLHGFALAGVPGIGIGRTPSASWGLTAGLVQDLDLFVERVKPGDETYLTQTGWNKLQARVEVFHVKNERSVARTVYTSHHGPLLETIATQPESPPVSEEHRFAVAWTAHQPSRELDALLGIWRAKSFDDFRTAARHHVCPTFNLTYAGADGQVGYVLAGAIPKRRRDTPLRPLEGWTGEWDWQGLVPPEDNPYVVDPEGGFVVTANNRIAPLEYPWELGSLFEPPERFARITERLSQLGRNITFDDMAALQADTYSAWGLATRNALLPVAGGVEGVAPKARSVQRQAAELWAAWDGYARQDAAGAAIAFMTAFNTGREVVRQLAGDDAARGFLEMASFICEPILRLPDLQARLAERGVDLAEVIRRAFRRSVQECIQKMGTNPHRWTWGQMHPVICKHRLDKSPVGPWLSLGPEAGEGGPDTVNRGDIDGSNSFGLKVAAAMRMVVNAANRNQARTIVPGGQSGNRFSQHYDDQLSLWLRGKLKAAPVDASELHSPLRETFHPSS